MQYKWYKINYSLLILVLLTSSLLAKTPVEEGYDILSNAERIYKLQFKYSTCTKLSKQQSADLLGIWKRRGYIISAELANNLNKTSYSSPQIMKADFLNIDLGNGQTLLAEGQLYFKMYIADNLELCHKLAKKRNVKELEKIIQSVYGTNRHIRVD